MATPSAAAADRSFSKDWAAGTHSRWPVVPTGARASRGMRPLPYAARSTGTPSALTRYPDPPRVEVPAVEVGAVSATALARTSENAVADPAAGCARGAEREPRVASICAMRHALGDGEKPVHPHSVRRLRRPIGT